MKQLSGTKIIYEEAIMKKKIYFIHPAIHNIDEFVKYLRVENLPCIDSIEWDSNDPSVVFASEMIYCDKRCFESFKKLFRNQKRIFVFHGGEAIYPDMNLFDYAITQATDFSSNNRITRMPPHFFYQRSLLQGDFKNSLNEEEARKILSNRKFCNFIYSNPFSHPMRDQLFYNILEYKPIDSLGAHLNNTNIPPSRRETNWAELSVKLKANYKFSIACENALCCGYTSEKLLTSFQAHTVPIYWGNPAVTKEYNENAFINLHSFDSFDELLKRIEYIDTHDEEWIKMVTSPWQTEEQVKYTTYEMKAYLAFMEYLLRIDSMPKKEIPSGTFTNVYRDSFFNSYKTKKHVLRKVVFSVSRKIERFLRRIIKK